MAFFQSCSGIILFLEAWATAAKLLPHLPTFQSDKCLSGHATRPLIFLLHSLLYILHLGAGLWFYELMPEMRRILLKALPWLQEPKILSAVKEGRLIEKFLFGSNFPILDFSHYTKKFTDSGLNDDELKIITRHNVLKLLSIHII